MTFSIIVPVYNVSKYLRVCLDSIIAQQVTDYELILVDDGSQDNSGQICDEYAKSHSQIKVIHKQNGGLASARNAGLDVASGEWVLFVDSDDAVAVDMLNVLVNSINKHKSDLYVFNSRRMDEQGQLGSKQIFFAENKLTGIGTEKALLDYLESDFLQYKSSWEAWNRLYRRDIIEKNSLRFKNEKEIMAEDYYFNLQYLLYIKSFYCVCNILYFYRENPNSLMSNNKAVTMLPRLTKLALLYYSDIEQRKLKDMKKNFYRLYFHIINFHVAHKLSTMSDSEVAEQIKMLRDENKITEKWLQQIKNDRNNLIKFECLRPWN